MMKKVIIGLACFLVLGLVYGYFLLDNDYESMVDVEHLKATYNIVENDDYIELSKGDTLNDLGLVMYGSDNVESEAFLDLLTVGADLNVKTFIIKSTSGASKVIGVHPEINQWVVMGHSSGGMTASSFANDNDHLVKGLILLASYPKEGLDLSNKGIDVLSIWGSEDLVMDLEKIEASKKQMPKGAVFHEISGANHSQFGNYGFRKGDGQATIDRDEQIEIVSGLMEEYLLGLMNEKSVRENQMIALMEEQLNVTYKDQSSNISIRALGDIMFHGPQVRAAQTDDGYDFSENFKAVSNYLSEADITIANLETTLSGEDKGYSGYPRFNTPDQALKAIEDAGIDVLSVANNHIADKGLYGYDRTLDKIIESPMEYIGGIKNDGESQFKVLEVNGLKLALIGATYETPLVNGKRTLNGSYFDESIQERLLSFRYDQLDFFYERIKTDMDKLEDVDLKIMMIHWGNEYWLNKNDHQKRIARGLSDMGFDIVLGSHPHVIEEVEWIGDTLVVYSLGNFISNQSSETTGRPHTEDGMIVHIEKEVDRYGQSDGLKYSVIPTWVDKYSDGQYRVVPVEEGFLGNLSGYSLNKYLLSMDRHDTYYKDEHNFIPFDDL